jgi:phospholipid transport system substrate-binding protein
MLNRLLSILLFLVFVGGFVLEANAQDRSKEVKQLLEQRDREIKQLLGSKNTFTEEQKDKLKDVINAGIDFEAMGRTALGEHWSKITPAQRKEFVDVFSAIVRNQSLSNLDVYRAQVTYKSVTVKDNVAHVQTTTVYKNVPTRVDYVLGLADGEWRVQDIVLDDVSTADGYARSFQTVVRKKGFDSLMASLHKKLGDTTS